ncbi:MAG: AraC family ligand binding domain-containing protein [Clostridiales bacterium]|jgi:mannose-6-phosphate isomerase-like protein (cupin superfamily)|nr:AraC family ligand binding domain-containing protein [Clostridiales bacterium]
MKDLHELNLQEYQNIPICRMADNNNGGLPVFIGKYGASRMDLPLHRHEMMQINYVSRGRLLHEINHLRHRLVKGDIFVIPPYIPHRILLDGNSDYEVTELEFMPEFVLQNLSMAGNTESCALFFDFYYIEPFLASECNVKPRLTLSVSEQMAVELLFVEFEQEYRARCDGYLLAMRAILLKLLVHLSRCFNHAGGGVRLAVMAYTRNIGCL